MNVYVALIRDCFYEQEFIVGVYTTYEKAESAINIVLEQRKSKEPADVVEGRFDWDIAELQVDAFNSNALWIIAE